MAKKMPGHRWLTQGEVVSDDGCPRPCTYFLYVCTKCGVQTLNGKPLQSPYDTECK